MNGTNIELWRHLATINSINLGGGDGYWGGGRELPFYDTWPLVASHAKTEGNLRVWFPLYLLEFVVVQK